MSDLGAGHASPHERHPRPRRRASARRDACRADPRGDVAPRDLRRRGRRRGEDGAAVEPHEWCGDAPAAVGGGLRGGRSRQCRLASSRGAGTRCAGECCRLTTSSAVEYEGALFLLPEASGRGRTVPSGKIFEYLAAERPILAAVPPGGEAGQLPAGPQGPQGPQGPKGDQLLRSVA